MISCRAGRHTRPVAGGRRRASQRPATECGAGGSPYCIRVVRVGWVQSVRYVSVLADQFEPRRRRLELEQSREVVVAMAPAEQGLDELVHQRGHRERDLLFPCGGQPEVEVLAQQGGGEGGVEIEVDEGG